MASNLKLVDVSVLRNHFRFCFLCYCLKELSLFEYY